MDTLLALPGAVDLEKTFGQRAVKATMRECLAGLTRAWRSGGPVPAEKTVLDAARRKLEEVFKPSLRRVINATGVVLHTNLGRAPLPQQVLQDLSGVLGGYVDLEIDLEAHRRGHRDHRIESSIRDLLGTDRSVVVVNNNAAAVLLLLNTLSAGRECLLSRGELVEIGGGFRMPEVMKASGARLKEVGTTNRTRLSDYREAIGPDTGLLLKVHTSNYRVLGFTQEVSPAELVALGKEAGLPVGFDLGSGLVAAPAKAGLADEPSVQEALKAGPDALCFSADKLFGACQAGLLMVEPDLAAAFRANPLLRALRVDKVTYFLLGAMVDLYRRERLDAVPALAMLARSEASLKASARVLMREVQAAAPAGFELEIVQAEGRVGAGSAPLAPLPSPALALKPAKGSVEALEAFLRTGGDPPIVSVISEGRLHVHVRTLFPGDKPLLVRRLAQFKEVKPA
jgi:L-seryl-tRNA(Ser) seleniumtransferase